MGRSPLEIKKEPNKYVNYIFKLSVFFFKFSTKNNFFVYTEPLATWTYADLN